jgi:hypothetical protein
MDYLLKNHAHSSGTFDPEFAAPAKSATLLM